MKTALRKPYMTSWLAIPVLILLGIIFSQHTVDIQLADTYYVIGNLHFAFAASIFLLVIGAGYWLMSRRTTRPNRTLTATHLILTLAALVTFTLPLFTGNWLVWIAMALVLSQVLYIINMFVVVLRRSPSAHRKET
ncbi:hypothetical protein [Spirosoma validum]|uniref:Uncharacterized protein n=1 Tax=Spirosoma validum TaxID=2771355 RepID=A0A927B2E7_9BACT|nr:hypothetical protein [Spirosoma validum]MBD2754007.1 hypothetical protein [Spirosoma validum]